MDDRKHSGITPIRILAITDGDSFTVEMPNWPEYLGQSIGIRISGVDTPEMRSRNPHEKAMAIEARRFLHSILNSGGVITLHRIQRDKYFRLLADVEVDGHNLSLLLIKAGYARRYVGGKRQAW